MKLFQKKALLLKHYQLFKRNYGQFLQKIVAPLFVMSKFNISKEQVNKLLYKKVVGQMRLNQLNHCDRYVIIYSSNPSNARRQTLINIRRQLVLQLIEKYGQPNLLYYIHLRQFNLFVPDNLLREQLKLAIQTNNQDNIKNSRNKSDSALIRQILFPYNHQEWIKLLSKRFDTNNINKININGTYLEIQLYNFYIMQHTILRKYIYEDIKQLCTVLQKFDFVTFFKSASFGDQYKYLKFVQRFLKMIKWKSKQSQRYTLLILRNLSDENFIICINHMVYLYQKYYQKQ